MVVEKHTNILSEPISGLTKELIRPIFNKKLLWWKINIVAKFGFIWCPLSRQILLLTDRLSDMTRSFSDLNRTLNINTVWGLGRIFKHVTHGMILFLDSCWKTYKYPVKIYIWRFKRTLSNKYQILWLNAVALDGSSRALQKVGFGTISIKNCYNGIQILWPNLVLLGSLFCPISCFEQSDWRTWLDRLRTL